MSSTTTIMHDNASIDQSSRAAPSAIARTDTVNVTPMPALPAVLNPATGSDTLTPSTTTITGGSSTTDPDTGIDEAIPQPPKESELRKVQSKIKVMFFNGKQVAVSLKKTGSGKLLPGVYTMSGKKLVPQYECSLLKAEGRTRNKYGKGRTPPSIPPKFPEPAKTRPKEHVQFAIANTTLQSEPFLAESTPLQNPNEGRRKLRDLFKRRSAGRPTPSPPSVLSTETHEPEVDRLTCEQALKTCEPKAKVLASPNPIPKHIRKARKHGFANYTPWEAIGPPPGNNVGIICTQPRDREWEKHKSLEGRHREILADRALVEKRKKIDAQLQQVLGEAHDSEKSSSQAKSTDTMWPSGETDVTTPSSGGLKQVHNNLPSKNNGVSILDSDRSVPQEFVPNDVSRAKSSPPSSGDAKSTVSTTEEPLTKDQIVKVRAGLRALADRPPHARHHVIRRHHEGQKLKVLDEVEDGHTNGVAYAFNSDADTAKLQSLTIDAIVEAVVVQKMDLSARENGDIVAMLGNIHQRQALVLEQSYEINRVKLNNKDTELETHRQANVTLHDDLRAAHLKLHHLKHRASHHIRSPSGLVSNGPVTINENRDGLVAMMIQQDHYWEDLKAAHAKLAYYEANVEPTELEELKHEFHPLPAWKEQASGMTRVCAQRDRLQRECDEMCAELTALQETCGETSAVEGQATWSTPRETVETRSAEMLHQSPAGSSTLDSGATVAGMKVRRPAKASMIPISTHKTPLTKAMRPSASRCHGKSSVQTVFPRQTRATVELSSPSLKAQALAPALAIPTRRMPSLLPSQHHPLVSGSLEEQSKATSPRGGELLPEQASPTRQRQHHRRLKPDPQFAPAGPATGTAVHDFAYKDTLPHHHRSKAVVVNITSGPDVWKGRKAAPTPATNPVETPPQAIETIASSETDTIAAEALASDLPSSERTERAKVGMCSKFLRCVRGAFSRAHGRNRTRP